MRIRGMFTWVSRGTNLQVSEKVYKHVNYWFECFGSYKNIGHLYRVVQKSLDTNGNMLNIECQVTFCTTLYITYTLFQLAHDTLPHPLYNEFILSRTTQATWQWRQDVKNVVYELYVYEYIVYKKMHRSLDTRDMLNMECQVTCEPSCAVQYTFCTFMEKSKERRI